MTENIQQKNFEKIRNKAHPKCVVCSVANHEGMHLRFDVSGDGGIESEFDCDQVFEGYPGLMHGGVIASILDGAMGNCMFSYGKATVTVEMTTRYRHPVLIGKRASVCAKIIRNAHPMYILESQIIQDGQIKATSKGKYYYQSKLLD